MIAFFSVGFLMGSLRNLPFAGIHRNSPYLLAYFIGITSLGAIFITTISVAQSLLKDRMANFESILFATQIRKIDYLFAQFTALFLVTCACMCLNTLGVFAGNYMPWLPIAERGTFSSAGYLWPLLVLAVPNILLCIAITACIAWLTRSAIGVYAGGLMIYILYIAGSIISNSPIMAGASPASVEEMSLVAKLDPFGLAAFFEQTRYWTINDRNTVLIHFRGDLLFNRICWFTISLIVLAFSYYRFSFRKLKSVQTKKAIVNDQKGGTAKIYTPVPVTHDNVGYNFRTIGTLVKMDLQIVIKGVPFVVIVLMLSALLMFELSNEVNAGVRLAQHYADTGLMITVLFSTLPFMAALVLLFYSNELLWKGSNVGFAAIQTTNPVPNFLFYTGKLLSLAAIILFLLGWSICIAMVVQVIYDYPVINWGLYASLFYYLGLPLLFLSVMLLFIQNCSGNKYIALVTGALFILFFNSKIGYAIGLQHTLIRFANTIAISYWKMNGFGEYTTSFNWQMINEGAISVFLAVVTILCWNRDHLTSLLERIVKLRFSKLQLYTALSALLIFLISSAFIYYQTDIKFPVLSQKKNSTGGKPTNVVIKNLSLIRNLL
jgi:hypothetical protein